MVTYFLIVRPHGRRIVLPPTSPFPHHSPGPLSSNSFPHNLLSDPHPLNPVVSIFYKNIGGGGPLLLQTLNSWSLSFIPFPFYILHTLLRHGLSTTPLESIRSALFPSRRRVYPPPVPMLTHLCAPIPSRRWRSRTSRAIMSPALPPPRIKNDAPRLA